MIRVELVKLLTRPRTWITILALNALPTLVAVLLAVTDLGPRPGTGPPFLSAVLTDGTLFPLAALGIVLPLFLPVAVAVVGGDARCLSIAAASIVAKVTRDRIMRDLAAAHPGYGWETNMGYGVRAHAQGIARLGITAHHRRSFRPVRLALDGAAQKA